MSAVVGCENLVHIYGTVGSEVAALRGVDFHVDEGETVALLGPSGAGKSTLLWHLAGLLHPTAGTVEVNGHRLTGMSPAELGAFRLREVGVVLQNAGRNLLPYLSALENLLYVQQPTRRRGGDKHKRARAMLQAVGLSDFGDRRAGSLAGGEQQRLALATALVNSPTLLLADEPTSQLERTAGDELVELIRTVNNEFGTTVIVVTHDAAVSDAFDRTVTIRDGRIGAMGFAGEDYVVVARDGSVQIPPDLLDALPPGAIARAERTDDGVSLHRITFDEPGSTP